MNSQPAHRWQRAWRWAVRHLGGLVVVPLIASAFVIGYGLSRSNQHASADASTPSSNEPTQWYTCSMHPDVRMPNPGDKCPICFMDLVPVASSSASNASAGPGRITLSPAAQALIDVQTVPAQRRFITHRVRMVGEVAYDETQLAYITAYVAGRLDRMYVDYTGIRVRKGDHLADIYSPELLVAQRELIEAKRSIDRLGPNAGGVARDAARTMRDAARERLRLMGLTDAQVEAIEAGGQTLDDDHVTIYAPKGGIVIEKHAKPGSYVDEGDRIVTLADLAQVWVVLEAYESDLPWLRYGQTVRFMTESFGDETFEGRIVFIDPVLDPSTRTVRVRVNVDNTDGRLRPGMFVRAAAEADVARGGRVMAPELAGKWISPMHPEVVSDGPGDCPVCGMDLVPAEELGFVTADAADDEGGDDARAPLVVPDSAVLRTGRRGVVYVRVEGDDEGATFEGRQIELGPKGDGYFVVRDGLVEGERVAVRGNFQIDSALQIEAKASMMNPRDTATAPLQSSATQPAAHVHGDAATPIAAMFDAYLAVADALADDDPAAAGDTADALQEAIAAVEDAALPDAAASLWAQAAPELREGARAIRSAHTLEPMRAAFEPVSDALLGLAGSMHVDGVGTLYRAHCPMAFDNRGADWLTDESTIANPYFGASMLRCGTIEQTLTAGSHAAPSHD